MLDFTIDKKLCIQCGLCIQDCPMQVLEMREFPKLKGNDCIQCQHCLAICPTAAVSILGNDPNDSLSLKRTSFKADNMEKLIKGRRSIRKYKKSNLQPEVIERLLNTAWHAPTAVNNLPVLATVTMDKKDTEALKNEIYQRLEKHIEAGTLPDTPAAHYLEWACDARKEFNKDFVFRNAPHLLITSTPRHGAAPLVDCNIYMSYFEIMCQTLGVGTQWAGMIKTAIDDIFPDLRQKLGIPEDHIIGYAMIFGKPAVKYQRTIERSPARINKPKLS